MLFRGVKGTGTFLAIYERRSEVFLCVYLEGYFMEMIWNIRKAVETGVMSVAVSALMLAGCGGGGGGAGASAINNNFIAALTDGVGLRMVRLTANPAIATVVTATAHTSGSYEMVLNEKAWSGSTWQVASAAASAPGYNLNAAGTWVKDSEPMLFAAKTVDSITSEGETQTWLAVDLSGARIQAGQNFNLVDPAISGGSAVLSVGAVAIPSASAVYPAGSNAWIGIGLTYAQDFYSVSSYGMTMPAQTPAGKLASLNFSDAVNFTTDNPLCLGWTTLVYASSPATNTAHFNVYNAQVNCTAIAGGTTPSGSVDLTYQLARTQPVAVFANYTGSATNAFSYVSGTVVMPTFLALINGGVYHGSMYTAGTNKNVLMANGYTRQNGLLNKTAMDAAMAALGVPSF